MKAERKEEEKWVPIVITLESKEEAQYLWHCLEMTYPVMSNLRNGRSKSIPFPKIDPGVYEMFDKLDDVLKGRSKQWH